MNEWMHTLKFTCVHLNVFYLTVVSSLLLKIIMENSFFYCLILLNYIQQVSHFFFQSGFILKQAQNRVNFILVNFLVQDPVEMELSVRIPFELPLFQQSVIN